jgi:hypothetical protein
MMYNNRFAVDHVGDIITKPLIPPDNRQMHQTEVRKMIIVKKMEWSS